MREGKMNRLRALELHQTVTKGGPTEEVTWDSIVVPRLPKYYSTAAKSYVFETLMASTAISKRIVGAQPHGDSPRGIIPIRSYRNAERIVSYQSDRSQIGSSIHK